jgi:fructokinase
MSRSALINLTEKELYEVLLFATKAAALVCSRRGAAPPSKREIDSIKLPLPKATPVKNTSKEK